MSDLECTKCGGDLDCMSGCSAHRSNWYCPICDQPERTRARLEKLEAHADLAAERERELVVVLSALHERLVECSKHPISAAEAYDSDYRERVADALATHNTEGES